jgi:hypothetical protein
MSAFQGATDNGEVSGYGYYAAQMTSIVIKSADGDPSQFVGRYFLYRTKQ